MHTKIFLFMIALISLAQGCSFSNSSKSLASNSDSSASGKSSPSSSKDDEKYQLEVLNYTSTYITSSSFDHFTFTRGISEIAIANGITSWEEDEATLIGIGRGLKNSNISVNLYEKYKESLAGSDSNKALWIQKGYDIQ